ncbi:MAG: hypothetical protein PVS2B2_23540 [Candidatus Acidiferrum sp.]
MLNLRLARGPLVQSENEAILGEYNRLTSSQIPMQEFLRWIQSGPEGPAWHAILQSDEGEIVGHTSLIPLRGNWNGKRIVPAFSEYSYIREEFRTKKIRGFEELTRLKNVTLIDKLFRHCQSLGWGPLLISTSAAVHRLYRSVGCYPTNFPVWECLLVLRPWKAAVGTPNLSGSQRAVVFLGGVCQRMVWSPTAFFPSRSNGIRSVSTSDDALPNETNSLSFFVDQDSLRWRYLEGQYERLLLDVEGREYAIVKKGSTDRYLRVCQWRLNSGQPSLALITHLIQMAQKQRALGVRWSVYGDDAASKAFISRVRWYGFLCAQRVRTLLICTKDEELLAPENWNLTDAMFSFDP